MKAVICGYGVVGKGVEILSKQVKDLEIQSVFVRKEKENLPYFTSNMDCVIDPNVDIVFECLNGIEPANTLIRNALMAKKHVITSNKAVISTYLEDYLELCDTYGSTLQIEACVAGGIPFLDALLKLQRLESLNGFEGIFNGTSNFILDSMQSNQMSYETALAIAQEKGYAEKDPTNDVEGIDVWYKANIANMLAYSTHSIPLESPLGISHINTQDIQFAKAHQKVIRHAAISSHKHNTISTIIAPVFYDKTHFLASVPLNYNAQLIHAFSFESLGYYGQGAGQLATAQAMIQNALDILDTSIRSIHLEHHYHLDNSTIQEDWIIRSDKDLSSIPSITKKDGDYYMMIQSNPSFIKLIQELDENAMIAIWR